MKNTKWTYAKIEAWIWSMAESCAQGWFRLQCQKPYEHFYLYYRTGEIVVAEERPEGFELGTGQRVNSGFTVEQCRRWIHDQARKLPILTKEMSV